jgi:hypothetical protein
MTPQDILVRARTLAEEIYGEALVEWIDATLARLEQSDLPIAVRRRGLNRGGTKE